MLNFNDYIQQLFHPNTKITDITDIGTTDIVSVSSTCLDEVRYDLLSKTLTVTFAQSGAEYAYYGVPEDVYQSIVNAGSVGQAYNFDLKQTPYGLFYQRVG